MIKKLKNILFGNKEVRAESAERANRDNCWFLNKPLEEQNDRLLKDGHFTLVYQTPSAHINFTEKKGSDRIEKASLPVHMKFSARINTSANERVPLLKPREGLMEEVCEYFEALLSETIAAEVYNNRLAYNKHLKNLEESSYRSESYKFFMACYETFSHTDTDVLNQVHRLPDYANSANFLSKTWLFEQNMKSNIFVSERELIVLFLYCQDYINKETIYHDYAAVGHFVRFIARRNFMIELNKTYGFEVSHPYILVNDSIISFEGYKELFSSKSIFDWTVKTIESHEAKNTAFFNELTKVLLDNHGFVGAAPIVRFCSFINDNYHRNLSKLRPTQCTGKASKDRIEGMQESLKLFLAS